MEEKSKLILRLYPSDTEEMATFPDLRDFPHSFLITDCSFITPQTQICFAGACSTVWYARIRRSSEGFFFLHLDFVLMV